ncbi:MAG TPA: SCO family protein [Candidatus Binatia bacterium]|nr:SCO family protein [Candidatus Binatia bacterium]
MSTSRLLASTTILLGLCVAPAFPHLPIAPKQPELGRKATQTAVSEFSLIDQNGNSFRLSNARGKIVLATFIFTTCPDVCPLLTAKFATIQRSLRERKINHYLLLSITTDPARDTPAVLKSYGEQFKADFNHWLFLTGSEKDSAKVWQGFGVTVRKTAEGQIQHTALTTLIDRRGVRRVDYYTDKWQEKEILKDIASLDSSSR